MNLDSSVAEAFKGTLAYATYPSKGDPVQGYDALVLVDDSSGANPAEVADKVRDYFVRVYSRNSPGKTLFSPLSLAGAAQAFSLSDDFREKEENELFSSLDNKSKEIWRGKTVAWATADNAVLISTSKDLLGRAVKAYKGEGDLLSRDPQLPTDAKFGSDGPQIYGVTNISKSVEGMQSTLPWDQMPPNARDALQAILNSLKKVTTPGTLWLRAGQDAVSAKMFMPLDFESLSKTIKDNKGKFADMFSPANFVSARPARSACMSNLKQLAIAVKMRSTDNDDNPKLGEESWQADLREYVKSPAMMTCPDDPPGTRSYSVNPLVCNIPETAIVEPSGTVLMYEGSNGHLNFRHGGRANVVFCDTHVISVDPVGAKKLNWDPKKSPPPGAFAQAPGSNMPGGTAVPAPSIDPTVHH
jgi:prepilin-type processing-associated H-X9-DG protein